MIITRLLVLGLALSAGPGQAQRRQSVPPEIYPFRPMPRDEIQRRVERVTESKTAYADIRTLTARGMEGSARTQPWGGSFWPLIQGQVANVYQDKNLFRFMDYLSWKGNLEKFEKRRRQVLSRGLDLSPRDLARLAPSEKYDLLLGDQNFDLTNRTWNFVEVWGKHKRNGFASSVAYPNADFRLPRANDRMALWEGVCHGWAVAAGAYPRPRKTVVVTLPNGKRLPFYPEDIKALVSLAFANSPAQNEVQVEGFRCDESLPDQDEFGRYIDRRRAGESLLPRCADVHPAVWHLSVLEIMGQQRRSLVLEIDANNKVNNHPLASYSYRYFNPTRGARGTLNQVMLPVERYRNDPYRSSRHPDTRFIVGVEMSVRYVKWTMPRARPTNGPRDDKLKTKKYLYDLELDAAGKVVGGQWRVTRTVLDFDGRGRTGQPDFFWALKRDYMKHFQIDPQLPAWDGRTAPPESWRHAAHGSHAYTVWEAGPGVTCTVINDRTREARTVPCEFKTPRPRPLLNLVQRLVELSQ